MQKYLKTTENKSKNNKSKTKPAGIAECHQYALSTCNIRCVVFRAAEVQF